MRNQLSDIIKLIKSWIKYFKMIGTSKQAHEWLHRLNKLVDHLIASQVIRSTKVANVMRAVDRGDFYHGAGAYEDCPQAIGYNATISAPHMHAFALEWLKDVLVPGAKVLDVGSGSGYLCAAFYEMTERKGKIVGIEHIEELS
jgi:protein-L-isoaspartate(D-aspartate) O-methyltransferase